MNRETYRLLRYVAVAGNVLFILWITYNGIDEGFGSTLPEKVSYVALMALLVLNSYLVFRKSE